MMPLVCAGWLGTQQTADSMIRQLDPSARARVLAALAAVLLLGFGLLLFVWLTGRAVRRYRKSGDAVLRHPTPLPTDDWAARLLHQDQASGTGDTDGG